MAATLFRAGAKVTFILDEQQVDNFTILLDEMCEQDLLSRPLPEIIVPKDEGIYVCMKRLESMFHFPNCYHKIQIEITRELKFSKFGF